MILSSDIKIYLTQLLDKINNYKTDDVQSFAFIHGSSAKTSDNSFISDIDIDYWIRCQDNKIKIFNAFIYVLTLLIENNMYVKNLFIGIDNRFVFNFEIKKDGNILKYNSTEIKNRFINLYNDKIINKEELNELILNVLDHPTLISFKKLELILLKYKNIDWTIDEINRGEKIYRKIKIKLFDVFMTGLIKGVFIYEFKPGKYINVDLATHIFSLPKSYKNLGDSNKGDSNKQDLYDFLTNNAYIYNEPSIKNTFFAYDSFFRHYVKEEYLKMLKRLKKLLSMIYYNKNGTNTANTISTSNIVYNSFNKKLKNPKYKYIIKNIITDIKKFTTSNKITCLNQLNHRLDIVLYLIKYKEELEIKRLTIEILNDSKNICNYFPNNIQSLYNVLETYNKDIFINELKIYKNLLSTHLNNISLPYLIKYIQKLHFLIPFKIELPLPEKNRIS